MKQWNWDNNMSYLKYFQLLGLVITGTVATAVIGTAEYWFFLFIMKEQNAAGISAMTGGLLVGIVIARMIFDWLEEIY